jgi:hypothetical protein
VNCKYLSCVITQCMCEQMIITKMKKSKLLECSLAIKRKPIVYHNFRKVIFSTLFYQSTSSVVYHRVSGDALLFVTKSYLSKCYLNLFMSPILLPTMENKRIYSMSSFIYFTSQIPVFFCIQAPLCSRPFATIIRSQCHLCLFLGKNLP